MTRYLNLILLCIVIASSAKTDGQELNNNNYISVTGIQKNTTTWIAHSRGIQCEKIYYTDRLHVERFLESRMIAVHQVKVVSYMVPSVCGYSSGTTYYAEIDKDDLEKAVALGWVEAKEPE